jgi:hypothetical protein
MNTLFAIDLASPCGVHPAQRVGKSLSVNSVRRFNHDVRHDLILPVFAQGVLRNTGAAEGARRGLPQVRRYGSRLWTLPSLDIFGKARLKPSSDSRPVRASKT